MGDILGPLPARMRFMFGLLFVGFILWERRYLRLGKTPVVDFALFRTPSYRYGVLITTLFFAAMPVGFLLVTLFLQQGLGHPAVLVGAVSVPYALTSAVVAAIRRA